MQANANVILVYFYHWSILQSVSNWYSYKLLIYIICQMAKINSKNTKSKYWNFKKPYTWHFRKLFSSFYTCQCRHIYDILIHWLIFVHLLIAELWRFSHVACKYKSDWPNKLRWPSLRPCSQPAWPLSLKECKLWSFPKSQNISFLTLYCCSFSLGCTTMQSHVHGNAWCTENQQQNGDIDHVGRIPRWSENTRGIPEFGSFKVNDITRSRR